MILDHPVVSQAWTCQTAWRHPEVPSGASQGVQRGAYPWLLQGAHKGYKGAPTPGSFRDLKGGTGAPRSFRNLTGGKGAPGSFRNLSEGTGEPTGLLQGADWGYLGLLPSAVPLEGSHGRGVQQDWPPQEAHRGV
jgi:hypothetical protein